MDFDRLRRNWENLGKRDPMWAILTAPGTEGGRWDEAAFFRTGVEFVRWLGAWLAEQRVPIPTGEALDFGCGIGRLTQALAPHFNSVTGIDISQPMIDLARQKNCHGDKVRYVCNARPDLSIFSDASFDYVQTVIVLQHMRTEYQQRYLTEFARVLRPGGLLFFQIAVGERRPGAAPLAGETEPADEAHMEMHVTPPDRVAAALASHRARILRVEPDGWAGPWWDSAHYAVTRDDA